MSNPNNGKELAKSGQQTSVMSGRDGGREAGLKIAVGAGSFVSNFGWLGKLIHRTAKQKGWWMNPYRNDGELIALMHSELSEALESLRYGNPASEHIPAFSGVEEEFADVIIRIMDMAEARGYRIAEAIIAKIEFNAGRKFKHGGKQF